MLRVDFKHSELISETVTIMEFFGGENSHALQFGKPVQSHLAQKADPKRGNFGLHWAEIGSSAVHPSEALGPSAAADLQTYADVKTWERYRCNKKPIRPVE